MSEESKIPLQKEEPRYCPACGARVAAKATTCLMCGASLVEEKEETQEKESREMPKWARSLIIVAIALAILVGGGFGLYSLLGAEPEPEPEETTPTSRPTRTPTPTSTPTPTLTPTSTSTPTPIPPRVHEVEEGETLLDIAISYDVTVEEIEAINPGLDPEFIREGEVLLIPALTPTPGPTSTPKPGEPTPTPSDFTVHIVESGETLLSIAQEYSVTVSLIRTANDLPADEETIRVDQSLVIPIGTPKPSPTPTRDPNATPTPIPPYPAPPLLGPPDGATIVGGDEPVILQWASVSVLRDDEWYEVQLSQPEGGTVSETIYTHATVWRVPYELLSEAEPDMQDFRWQLQVVREIHDGEDAYEEASAPSAIRAFTWLKPTPTVGPASTATP